jgi:fatty acid synthase subunit alpha
MLVNLLRLLGSIVKQKRQRSLDTRPSHVILPLSPNRGILGNDGLYGESKIALEALLNKWHSEDWKYVLSFFLSLFLSFI